MSSEAFTKTFVKTLDEFIANPNDVTYSRMNTKKHLLMLAAKFELDWGKSNIINDLGYYECCIEGSYPNAINGECKKCIDHNKLLARAVRWAIEMKEKIMTFIMDAKTDKILFKGNPETINYKLLKKILPIDQIKFDKSVNSINKFVEIEDKDIREIYSDLIKSVDCEFCLIHKI